VIAAVALSAALLLLAIPEPPAIETHAAEATISADGEVHEIHFSTFSSAPVGVELALYLENVAVVSGACEVGWGVGGVEARATTPGTCVVTAAPHDPLTGATAAAPAQITVTAEAPSSSPVPGGAAADAPPAAASPSHRPVQAAPGDSPLSLVVAWAVLIGGGGAAIAVNRRDRERTFS